MKKKDNGFSVSELLIVIGIMAVISTIAIISISAIKKNMAITEADDQAKALYIAAQNQMLELKENNVWTDTIMKNDSISKGVTMAELPADFNYWRDKTSLSAEEINSSYTAGSKGNMYMLTNTSASDEALLNTYIFTYGIIDDAATKEGKYFIEYNVATATVYGVWYAKTDNISYSDIIAGIGTTGRESYDVSADDAKDARKNFDKGVVGYYGGGMSSDLETYKLDAPKVDLVNDENLIVNISDSNVISAGPANITIKVIGKSSNAMKTFTIDRKTNQLLCKNDDDEETVYSIDLKTRKWDTENDEEINETLCAYSSGEDGDTYPVVLDSILNLIGTNKDQPCENRHFISMLGEGFYAGENIEIAVSLSGGSSFIAAPVTRRVITNSLFYDVDDNGIQISSIRHLQNLSPDISGLLVGDKILDDARINFSKATLLNNISFSGQGAGNLYSINYRDLMANTSYLGYEGVKDKFGINENINSFYPIENTGIVCFDGDGCKICDLKETGLSKYENLGLFGKAGQIKISGLGLVGSNNWESENRIATPEYEMYISNGSDKDDTVIDFFEKFKDEETGKYNHVNISIGSFIGYCETAEIESCYTTTTLFEDNDSYLDGKENYFFDTDIYMGGFVGRAEKGVSIVKSYAGGKVEEDGLYATGNDSRANLCIKPIANGTTDKTDINSNIYAGSFVGAVIADKLSDDSSTILSNNYSTQSINVHYCTSDVIADYTNLYLGGFIGAVCFDKNDENKSVTINVENSYIAAPIITKIKTLYKESQSLEANIHIDPVISFVPSGSNRAANNIKVVGKFYDYTGYPIDINKGILGDNVARVSLEELAGVEVSEDKTVWSFKNKVISSNNVYPTVNILRGLAYVYGDPTELEHHYGDFEFVSAKNIDGGNDTEGTINHYRDSDDPNIFEEYKKQHNDFNGSDDTKHPLDNEKTVDIIIKNGHGIEEITIPYKNVKYGDEIVLPYTNNEQGFVFKDGYEGFDYIIDTGRNGSEGVIVIENGVPTYKVGVNDTVITVNATILQPPEIEVYNAGEYLYKQKGLSDLVYVNTKKYADGVSLHVLYEDDGGDIDCGNGNKVDLYGKNLLMKTSDPDNHELGTNSYLVRACVTDGVLTSTETRVIAEITFSRAKLIIDVNNTNADPKAGELYINGGSVNVANDNGNGQKVFYLNGGGDSTIYLNNINDDTLRTVALTRSKYKFTGNFYNVQTALYSTYPLGKIVANINDQGDITYTGATPTSLNNTKTIYAWWEPIRNAVFEK